MEFNFFKISNIKKTKETFFICCVLPILIMVSVLAGTVVLSENKQTEGIQEVVQFVEKNFDNNKSQIIKLNYLNNTNIQINKQNETILSIDSFPLSNNGRFEKLIVALKNNNIDVVGINYEKENILLTLKKKVN